MYILEIFTKFLQKIHHSNMPALSTMAFISFCSGILSMSALQAQTTGLMLDYAFVHASDFPVIISSLTVRDGNNRPVAGLTENNFTVFEDGIQQQPITVQAFGSDSGGVSVLLIMDISSSMRDELPDAKKAAIKLVNLLKHQDRGALISFDRNVHLELNFTEDMEQLKRAINSLKNGSGTAVYDATIYGVTLAQTRPGKKAIVLLADGRDGGSKAELDDVTKLLSTVQIPVYALGLGVNPNRGERELRAIAQASGGIFYKAPSTNDLEDIYRNIAFVISRNHYRITYTTSNCANDSTNRLVKIEVKNNGLTASDTNSYWAPYFPSQLLAKTDKAPTPSQPFTLKIAKPGSNDFAKSISEISFHLQYNTEYLGVRSPYGQNIVAGSLFGAPSDHTLTYSVDDAAGVVDIHIEKNNASVVVGNPDVFAEITFITDLALPDSTALSFQIDATQAKNVDDCEMIFEPLKITIYSDGLIVWPGDTNFNGHVELSDVLVLGQFWEINGPSRPGIENQLTWMPHVAKKYRIAKATHADADGGGHISERDLIPIGLNWGKSVQDYAPAAHPKTNALLPEGQVFSRIEPADLPGRYRLRLSVARTNIAPLAGIVLRMRYAGESISIESVKPGGLWLKEPLKFAKNDVVENLLAIGLMLPANSSLPENGGEMVQIVFSAARPVSPNDISFDNMGLVGANGRVNEIVVLNKFDASETIVPDVFELFPAYPNPFNPKTTLRFDLPEKMNVSAYIFNVSGKLIRRYKLGMQNAGRREIHWDGAGERGLAASSGIYIVRLVATNTKGVSHIAEQKISLVR